MFKVESDLHIMWGKQNITADHWEGTDKKLKRLHVFLDMKSFQYV